MWHLLTFTGCQVKAIINNRVATGHPLNSEDARYLDLLANVAEADEDGDVYGRNAFHGLLSAQAPMHVWEDREEKARRYFSDKGLLPTVDPGKEKVSGVGRGTALPARVHEHGEFVIGLWREVVGRGLEVFEPLNG